MDNSLLSQLGEVVGENNVCRDDQAAEKYGQDWTRFYAPAPAAVVFARDTEQLIRLVEFANREGLSLVPSGGRTGLSGGAVARAGEVVVSFEKMNRIVDFDPVDQSVTVEPGVVTAELQRFVAEQGLFYPVDFASSGSSQIGGNIATNAGGIRVLRYGLTREWVTGLKVITGRGELLALNRGLIKNATGYDFRHLFIGSEGTLGFIVEATLGLTRPPAEPVVILMGVAEMARVMDVFERFRSALTLSAYEFFSEAALGHVIEASGMSRPFDAEAPWYVLLEFDSGTTDQTRAEAAFEDCLDNGWVTDGVISRSEQQRAGLWHYREDISEAITPRTPWKNDVSVRVSQVPAFLAAVETAVEARYPDFEIVWFGHIGDGNLHLNVLKPDHLSIDDFRRECERVGDAVMKIVADFGGSVSAEHGVGLLKRDRLQHTRSDAEIRLMRQIRQVFDPNEVMNPGKLTVD